MQATFIALPESQFKELLSKVEKLSSAIEAAQLSAQSEWLSLEKYCEAMDISKSTFHRLANGELIKGLTLRTSSIGRKTYVHKQELNRVFEF